MRKLLLERCDVRIKSLSAHKAKAPHSNKEENGFLRLPKWTKLSVFNLIFRTMESHHRLVLWSKQNILRVICWRIAAGMCFGLNAPEFDFNASVSSPTPMTSGRRHFFPSQKPFRVPSQTQIDVELVSFGMSCHYPFSVAGKPIARHFDPYEANGG